MFIFVESLQSVRLFSNHEKIVALSSFRERRSLLRVRFWGFGRNRRPKALRLDSRRQRSEGRGLLGPHGRRSEGRGFERVRRQRSCGREVCGALVLRPRSEGRGLLGPLRQRSEGRGASLTRGVFLRVFTVLDGFPCSGDRPNPIPGIVCPVLIRGDVVQRPFESSRLRALRGRGSSQSSD